MRNYEMLNMYSTETLIEIKAELESKIISEKPNKSNISDFANIIIMLLVGLLSANSLFDALGNSDTIEICIFLLLAASIVFLFIEVSLISEISASKRFKKYHSKYKQELVIIDAILEERRNNK